MLATVPITSDLERARARIAELENIVLASQEWHDEQRRLLVEANNRLKDERVAARNDAERWRATADVLGVALVRAQRERDEALQVLNQAAREVGDQSMALDEGTEA